MDRGIGYNWESVKELERVTLDYLNWSGVSEIRLNKKDEIKNFLVFKKKIK
jgi:hypothetical protein